MDSRRKEMKNIIDALEDRLDDLYSFQDNVRGDDKEYWLQGVMSLENAIGHLKWLLN